jgi:hypothetical protein
LAVTEGCRFEPIKIDVLEAAKCYLRQNAIFSDSGMYKPEYEGIDAIEHEAVERDVKICGGSEPLAERDGTGLRLYAFKPAYLIRNNEMARLKTCKTGESRWGWEKQVALSSLYYRNFPWY